MTEIERIMLSEKYTIEFIRRGETIAREGFALSAKEAMNRLLYVNERPLVSAIFRQSDDGIIREIHNV